VAFPIPETEARELERAVNEKWVPEWGSRRAPRERHVHRLDRPSDEIRKTRVDRSVLVNGRSIDRRASRDRCRTALAMQLMPCSLVRAGEDAQVASRLLQMSRLPAGQATTSPLDGKTLRPERLCCSLKSYSGVQPNSLFQHAGQ
jgi:hypothetical protein